MMTMCFRIQIGTQGERARERVQKSSAGSMEALLLLSPAIVPYHYRMADPSGAVHCRKCAGKGAHRETVSAPVRRAFRSARSGSPSRRAVTATASSFSCCCSALFFLSFGRCIELLVQVDLVHCVSSLATVSPRFLSPSPPFSMVFQARRAHLQLHAANRMAGSRPKCSAYGGARARWFRAVHVLGEPPLGFPSIRLA